MDNLKITLCILFLVLSLYLKTNILHLVLHLKIKNIYYYKIKYIKKIKYNLKKIGK